MPYAQAKRNARGHGIGKVCCEMCNRIYKLQDEMYYFQCLLMDQGWIGKKRKVVCAVQHNYLLKQTVKN